MKATCGAAVRPPRTGRGYIVPTGPVFENVPRGSFLRATSCLSPFASLLCSRSRRPGLGTARARARAVPQELSLLARWAVRVVVPGRAATLVVAGAGSVSRRDRRGNRQRQNRKQPHNEPLGLAHAVTSSPYRSYRTAWAYRTGSTYDVFHNNGRPRWSD